MTRKRGHLLPRPDTERDRRASVAIDGTCRIGERPAEDVVVTDLGLSGCCLRGTWLGVTKADPLTLHIGDVGPLAAKLKWARRGSLGVAFDEPLAAATLARLCAEGADGVRRPGSALSRG
jgi:hypothetical protein